MGVPWRWPGKREVSLYGACSGPSSSNLWESSQGELRQCGVDLLIRHLVKGGSGSGSR